MGNTLKPLQPIPPSKLAKPSPRQAVAKPKPRRSMSRWLLHFAQRHPFLCLFATWGVILYFGWLGVSGLTYTNSAPLESPPAAAAPKPFKIAKPATSFGLLAVVAGSCTVTSVVLARKLRPAKSGAHLPAKRVAIAPKPQRSRPAVGSRPRPAPNARATAKPARKSAAHPPVTVLSPEDRAFEMRDPSLAEMMDIRQRRA